MIKIEYSPYPHRRTDKLSEEQIEIISKHDSYFIEEMEDNVSIVNVESPFILADNDFDLHEANNEILEINVVRTKSVSFTGGAYYMVYEKQPNTNHSYVIQGNSEEGYNIFNLI